MGLEGTWNPEGQGDQRGNRGIRREHRKNPGRGPKEKCAAKERKKTIIDPHQKKKAGEGYSGSHRGPQRGEEIRKDKRRNCL